MQQKISADDNFQIDSSSALRVKLVFITVGLDHSIFMTGQSMCLDKTTKYKSYSDKKCTLKYIQILP